VKVYLAGKISGDPDYKKKFHFTRLNIKKALRILSGNEELFDFEVNCRAEPVVLNPADLPGRMAPADYMRICFAMIDSADFVVFQPETPESAGAQLELLYCRYIGKPTGPCRTAGGCSHPQTRRCPNRAPSGETSGRMIKST